MDQSLTSKYSDLTTQPTLQDVLLQNIIRAHESNVKRLLGMETEKILMASKLIGEEKDVGDGKISQKREAGA